MTLISASSENAGCDDKEIADTPALKAAVLRKLRRLGAHSDGNMTTPILDALGIGNDGDSTTMSRLAIPRDRSSSCACAHQNQRALRERSIKQDRSQSQRQPVADLREKQKWRQGPEFIQRKNHWKQARKFFLKARGLERHHGKQIKANGNPDSRCNHQSHHNPDRARYSCRQN